MRTDTRRQGARLAPAGSEEEEEEETMDEDEAPHWWDEARREHEARLVVGTRVRIIEQECNHWHSLSAAYHGESFGGKTGLIVVAGRHSNAADGHGYYCSVDGVGPFGWFTASELEPLD